jgi:energy-coupling factor transporter ATP-binding protein EcfA2
MNIATAMYALGLDQIASAIKSGGSKRTVLVQGHMGTGKSSLLKMLSVDLPTHTACYFDCTTKDLGDISIPNLAKLNDGTGYVTYLTNEELGVHMGKPIILMIDEYGKANPAVKNAMLRLMLERKIGSYELHPESLVFATTNLGAEGVGDLLPPHARNRMTIITSRKPSNMEWIEWGINNGIDHTLLGWCKDNPQLFAGFEDVRDPDENPYIYHPQQQRAAFVTPRSLEAASDWLKQREHFDDQTLTSLLMGTIGERGAMDLMAFVKLADQLPSRESIKQDPMGAKVPDSASAICMVVYRSLASMDKEYVDPWMDYMARLDKEAQGMFANGVRQPKYSKQSLVMTNKKFTQWAMDNNYMFASDKK